MKWIAAHFWTLAWVAWLGLFVLMEGTALARPQRGDTLSEQVWKWFGVYAHQHISDWTFWHFLLLAFMAWLSCHFVLGWWR